MKRRAAEDEEPNSAYRRRDKHHAEDELAHCPPPRDAGDEHTDEGGPRERPRPIEYRPAFDPIAVGEGARREAHLEEAGEDIAEGLHSCVEDDDRRAKGEDEEREGDRDHHINIAQHEDALAERGRGADREADGDDDRDDDLSARAERGAERLME